MVENSQPFIAFSLLLNSWVLQANYIEVFSAEMEKIVDCNCIV